MNVTVPLGVATPGALTVTVAVNVTLVPARVGFTDDTSAVLVSALSTTNDVALEVLVPKFVSPA